MARFRNGSADCIRVSWFHLDHDEMTRVTISTITERGILPQFYGEFKRQFEADDYAAMWRKIAAQAGMLIRIDRDEQG